MSIFNNHDNWLTKDLPDGDDAFVQRVYDALLDRTPGEICDLFGLESEDLFKVVTGGTLGDLLTRKGYAEVAERLGVAS